jgi:hypothetical protein
VPSLPSPITTEAHSVATASLTTTSGAALDSKSISLSSLPPTSLSIVDSSSKPGRINASRGGHGSPNDLRGAPEGWMGKRNGNIRFPSVNSLSCI